jgi:hypothetical protein
MWTTHPCKACSWSSCSFSSKICDFETDRNFSSAILRAEKASKHRMKTKEQ